MILLHALDAPHDIPGIQIRRGDQMYHLLSDLPGSAGTADLLRFARRCGAQDAWLQAAGSYREHFDIFGQWADLAHDLGAIPAGNHQVATVLQRKRAATADWPEAVPAITSRQMRVVRAIMAHATNFDPVQAVGQAGTRVSELVRRLLENALSGARIAVLVGPGGTGRVGLVAARALQLAGAALQVYRTAQVPAWAGGDVLHDQVHDAPPSSAALAAADLIIDALLGDGIDGPPSGEIATMIAHANAAGRPILALDLPSGLDPDEDGPYADCIIAHTTLALGVPRRALILLKHARFGGDLWLAPLDIPRRVVKQVGAHPGATFANVALIHLARRPLAEPELYSPIAALVVQEA